MNEKQVMVMRELLNTEQSYLNDLQTIASVWEKPLREESIIDTT